MDALRFSAVLLILAMACFMTESTESCDKAKDEGTGNQNIASYFFDSATGTCETFFYKGSGNNDPFPNRFNSHAECENICKCKLRMDVGTGRRRRTRYYHNTDGSGCLPFQYTGTGGNTNNFAYKWDCQNECE